MSDSFTTYDAAYLLGALTPADRAAYEKHLTECTDCRRGVAQLAGMPGLLASVSADQARSVGDEVPDLPETLLPALMAEVQRTRFRRRVTTALVGVAAAAVLAVALVVGLQHSSTGDAGNGPPIAGIAQPMTPTSASVPITATAWLQHTAGGTRIEVKCIYHSPPTVGHYAAPSLTYSMVVIDKSGRTHRVVGWRAKPGPPIVVGGSASVATSQISAVQIRDLHNQPVLTLNL